MEIVKKNLLSIICGVVALIALIASVWPMGGYQQTLHDDLAKRTSVYSSLESLRNKSRHAPVVNTEKAEPEPLTRFPNKDLIDQGEAVKKSFETESKKILETAVGFNKHALLVANSLPSPRPAAAFQFRDQYKIAFEQTIPHDLKIGTLPTAESIKLAEQKLWDEKFAQQVINVGQGNRSQVDAEYARAKLDIPDQERLRIANESLCYMDPGALVIDQAMIAKAAAPDPVTIWFAQLGLWIQQDIAKAIADTNKGAANVLEAPVKHLIKISLRPSPYVLPPNVQGPIEGDAAAPINKVPEVSLTGRVTNPLYDVVDFELIVNVEADKIPWFLKELSNQKFITVLSMNVSSVDSAAQQALGFMYGPKPVAQVTLHCEEIFFRQWSRPLMPEAVAKNMGAGVAGGGIVPGFAPGGTGMPEDLPRGRGVY
jgi:hypothetical protein